MYDLAICMYEYVCIYSLLQACLALLQQPSPRHFASRAADSVLHTEEFRFRILVVLQRRWHILVEIAAGRSVGRMEHAAYTCVRPFTALCSATRCCSLSLHTHTHMYMLTCMYSRK